MTFQKGHQRYGGRAPGQQNKLTKTVKEAFGEAFELLGGAEALFRWGQTNKTEFYKLASKLIPTEVSMAIVETPEARVYPLGPPDEQNRLPAPPEAVDSLH